MKFYLYKLKHNAEKTQFYAYVFCKGKNKSKPVDHDGKPINLDKNIDPAFVIFAKKHLQYKFIHEISYHGLTCTFCLAGYTQIPYFIISKENKNKFHSADMDSLKWGIQFAIQEVNQAWLGLKEREAKLAAKAQNSTPKL
jgi:hypothetical protein